MGIRKAGLRVLVFALGSLLLALTVARHTAQKMAIITEACADLEKQACY